MKITEAQKNMRDAYFGGGPGVLASSIVWIITAIFVLISAFETSILCLFFGGMLIHPIGIKISKSLKRSGKHLRENSLAKLALESTVIIFVGLFIAFIVFKKDPFLFYPIMLMIIGVRYLMFQSIYGMKIYWILGIVLMLIGFISIAIGLPAKISVPIGGITELIFAVAIFRQEKI